MPRFVKSISFYNRALLVGFDSKKDDADVNAMLDGLRDAGAEIIEINTSISGGFLKHVSTYVVIYEAPEVVQ